MLLEHCRNCIFGNCWEDILDMVMVLSLALSAIYMSEKTLCRKDVNCSFPAISAQKDRSKFNCFFTRFQES